MEDPDMNWTKVPKTYDGEKTAASQMFLGKVLIHLQKTEAKSMFITLD
jgi:hypothetical protein